MSFNWLFLIPAAMVIVGLGTIVYSAVILNGGEPAWLVNMGLGSTLFTLPVYVAVSMIVDRRETK